MSFESTYNCHLAASCPDPVNITNGRLVDITGGMTNGSYFVGSVAHYECNPQYMSSDGPSICQANGTWEPKYTCTGNTNA